MVQIKEHTFDSAYILAVEGELDRVIVPLLEEKFAARLEEGERRLLLDLRDCTYVDSGGLGLILSLLRRVQPDGLLGIIDPSPPLRRLFEIAGLPSEEGFFIFRDEDEAADAVASR